MAKQRSWATRAYKARMAAQEVTSTPARPRPTEAKFGPIEPKLSKDNLLQYMELELHGVDKRLEKFVHDFQDFPLHALEWSVEVFELAARQHVYNEVHDALTRVDSKATIESITHYIVQKALDGASGGVSSTSAPSNLVREKETEAWARLAKAILGRTW